MSVLNTVLNTSSSILGAHTLFRRVHDVVAKPGSIVHEDAAATLAAGHYTNHTSLRTIRSDYLLFVVQGF